ncbi:MAG: hypothetical protein WCX69_02310 [Candidatus Paceibacterota bacterium]
MAKKIILLIFIVFLFSVGAGIWFFVARPKPAAPAATPGNFSGSIEIPPAPEVSPAQTGDWLTYADKTAGFSFKYPEKFGTDIWHPAQWPPMAKIIAAGENPVAIGCPKLYENNNKPRANSGTTASGVKLTLYVGSDIGAGQLYSEYCYVFESGKDYSATIDFIIQSPSGCGFGGCGAYCGTEHEKECQNLDRKTEIGTTIMQIIETASFGAQI